MQPQPSAQLKPKPGLPNIGQDPISKAIAWLVNNPVSKAVTSTIDSVGGDLMAPFVTTGKQFAGLAEQAMGGVGRPISPEEEARAQKGASMGMEGASMTPYIDAAIPFVKPALGQVKQEGLSVINNAKIQPGGMQAGFVKTGTETPTISSKAATVPEKLAMKANQVDDVKLPSEVGGAQAEARMQNTLNRVVPGGNLTEKYKNLQPTMDKISSQIQKKLLEKPTSVPMADVKSTLMDRLRPLVDNGTIPEREAEKQVTSYMARIYGSANNWDNMPDIANTMGPNGNVIPFSQKLEIPQEVPDSVLYRMKQLANDRAKGLFGKENLNPAQQTTLALRNGFDDVLTKYRPDIKELTMTQSDLFRAAEQGNLGGLREKSTGIGISVPGTNVKVGIPGAIADPLLRRPTAAFLNNLGESPLKTIGTAGGVAGGGILAAKGAGEIINDFSKNQIGGSNNPQSTGNQDQGGQGSKINNNSQNEYFHTSDIPQSPQDVNPNEYGVPTPSRILDSSGNVIGTNENDYNKQLQKTNNQIADWNKEIADNPFDEGIKRTNQAYITAAQTQLQSLKQLRDSSVGLNATAEFANSVSGSVKGAVDLLNSTSPNITNLNNTLSGIRKSLDPKYASLSQQLESVQKQIGSQGFNAATKEALVAELNQINKQIKYDYLQYVQSFVGGNSAIQSQGGTIPAVQQNPAFNPPTQLPPVGEDPVGKANSGTGVAHPFVY